MEVELRQRLEGVSDISISQSEQTAEVRFEGDHTFSPAEFRKAVGQAGVKVLRFEVDVCGSAAEEGGRHWLIAGKNRWPLTGDRAIPLGQPLCASGRLDDRTDPPTFEPLDIRSARESP
jgi:hypothetical protein